MAADPATIAMNPTPSNPRDVLLRVDGLKKTYSAQGRDVEAVRDLTFELVRGELTCIVGPSGSGKTTLLRCISGLLEPTSGSVVLDGAPVKGPPRGMAVVFQEYGRSLFAWMTVRQNVELPLKVQKMSKSERTRLVDQSLESVGLAHSADSYPWQLSGGMQQRVAIARALAYQPQLLLMDEPFASVDAQTRADLEDLVLRVRHQFDVTVLLVTHDIDESIYLSDRVVVLSSPPSTVREELEIPLPRRRDQVTTKELPEFAHLRAHVFRLIKRESGAETPDAHDSSSLATAGEL
nr:ABC-type nitrate/sulfonate/bicarbonate transport system, ATPase component [Aeromicrobium sp.]